MWHSIVISEQDLLQEISIGQVWIKLKLRLSLHHFMDNPSFSMMILAGLLEQLMMQSSLQRKKVQKKRMLYSFIQFSQMVSNRNWIIFARTLLCENLFSKTPSLGKVWQGNGF